MSKNIENRLLKLHLQDNMIWNANRLLHTGDWEKPRGRLGLFPKHPHGKKNRYGGHCNETRIELHTASTKEGGKGGESPSNKKRDRG